MCEECIIGIWHEYYDDNRLISFKELNELYDGTIYNLKDYYDRRKATNLTRFNFCPMCGKKINWKYKNNGSNKI